MKAVDFNVTIEDAPDGAAMLKRLERCGRTCYKSESRITDESAGKFIAKIIESGHESVLEHEKVTVRIVCDRGVTHEIVRHRIGSYSQESTRYCNYAGDKFGSQITCIKPSFWSTDEEKMRLWTEAMEAAEKYYFDLLSSGATAQEARSVLPNSLKTEIVVTYDLREWRHFLRLRCAPAAHPQMREVAMRLLVLLSDAVPVVFDDLKKTFLQ